MYSLNIMNNCVDHLNYTFEGNILRTCFQGRVVKYHLENGEELAEALLCYAFSSLSSVG